MANQSGRPIAPARKLMAAVLGTIGVFVMVYGLGLTSWSIVILGLVLVALAIVLAMVNVVRRGARAWVAGTIEVRAVSQPPSSSVYGRAEMAVLVIAPGLPMREVTIRDPRVPVEKWPLPGDTLHATVDVDDMRRVRINWDEAPSRADSPDLNPPPSAYDLADEDLQDDDLQADVGPLPWATPSDPAGGPIVEGELVGVDAGPPPLPRRAPTRQPGSRPSPHPHAATATINPETTVDTPEAPPYTIPAQSTGAADDDATGTTRGPWADLEGGGFEPEDRTAELITTYPSARPGPAAAIHGIGITLLVTDLRRSIAFYRDVLGFFEIDSSSAAAVLASGDTRMVLRTVHDLTAEAGRLIYLNLEVGDLQAVYEELKAEGITFEHGPRPVNRGDKLELWAASFSDPDNHNIAITQWRAVH